MIIISTVFKPEGFQFDPLLCQNWNICVTILVAKPHLSFRQRSVDRVPASAGSLPAKD